MLEYIIFGLILVILLVCGIFALITYKKTKNKKFLIIGLILTFIFIGVLIFIIFIYIPSTMMAYGPGPA
ncbi:MAG: hypothetical protein NT038_02550 [Euryarchaeota archaeon]|nr:hypothetical protein [Euryarchaeota archaeon]